MPGEDSLLSLYLKVEGGAASAAEIDDLKGRLGELDKEVDATQADISGKFSQKFEHIALRGFLADGARAVGLGGELRPVLSAVQMGLVGVDEAMGPWLLGLAAVSALLYTVIENSKKHSEGLEDNLKKYQEATAAIDDYVESGGKLTDALKRVAEQQRENTAETLKAISSENQRNLAHDEAAIKLAKLQEAESNAEREMGLASEAMTVATADIKKLTAARNADKAEVEANAKGYATSAEMLAKETQANKDATKAIDERAKAEQDWIDIQDQEAAEQEKLAGVYEAAVNQEAEIQKKYNLESKALTDDLFRSSLDKVDAWKAGELAKIQDTCSKKLDLLKGYNGDTSALEQNEVSEIAALDSLAAAKKTAELQKLLGIEHTGWAAIQSIGVNAMKSIVDSSSTSLAKTLVEHKNFADATKYIWRDLAEQIIGSLIKMGEQAVINAVIQKTESAAASAAIIADNTAVAASWAAVAAAATAAATAEKAAMMLA